MQKPTEQLMTNVNRLGRYLKKRPRLVQLLVEQTSTANVVRLDVYGDSDHAGGLKVSSHTQSTVSLRCGESEYYGIVKCAAIGFGARSMLADFGMCADVVIRTDSSSGLSVGSRRGLGRLRHVQTRYLWVQQRVQEGDLRLKKRAERHERERRAHQASGREAHAELVDNDGLRVQRRAHSFNAGSAVTNWRLKSSMSLRRTASCFQQRPVSSPAAGIFRSDDCSIDDPGKPVRTEQKGDMEELACTLV